MNIARLMIALLLSSGVLHAQSQTRTSGDTTVLAAYIRAHAAPAEEYVLSKFAAHDVVLIGEPHWIKQHVELIQRLIPRLYEQGIYTLAIEFARRVDQPLIDSLLALPEYDEQLARKLLLLQLPQWGYQEYADLYKRAWQVNHALPRGARRFRILALGDAPDWSVIKTSADFDDWRVRRVAFHGETEQDWAQVVIDKVLAKNEKALVYTGKHHALTRYSQPIVSNGKFIRKEESARFGQFLYAYAAARVFMIVLHAPWAGVGGYSSGWVLPADGAIDEVFRRMPADRRRVGFDLIGTPMGALVSETAVYKHGYEPFTLERLADGYIYFGPVSEFAAVTVIPDFINEGNIELARAMSAHPSYRTMSIADFNAGIVSALEVVEKWRAVGRHVAR